MTIDERNYDISNEHSYYDSNPSESLNRLALDHDFAADIRNLLICFNDDDFDIIRFIDDECDSNRILDIRRAHLIISDLYSNPYKRDEFTQLALSESLCPIHLIDYAICFDDDDAECEQIRRIHPSHDT